MVTFSDQNDAIQTKFRIQDKVQEQIAKKRKESRRILNIYAAHNRAQTQQGTPLSKAIKEVPVYVDDEILPRRDESGNLESPGKWWLTHKHVYPHLA